MSGQKIIDGLKDAVAGNFNRVTVEGQTWVRYSDIPDNPVILSRAQYEALMAAQQVLCKFRGVLYDHLNGKDSLEIEKAVNTLRAAGIPEGE